MPHFLPLWEQPCSLQKIHVASCSYEQTVSNTWGIVLCGSIRWFLSWTVLTPCDLDAWQRSLRHHGFPKKQLENSESPNQTTQRLGLKQSNRITIFCWSYQAGCSKFIQFMVKSCSPFSLCTHHMTFTTSTKILYSSALHWETFGRALMPASAGWPQAARGLKRQKSTKAKKAWKHPRNNICLERLGQLSCFSFTSSVTQSMGASHWSWLWSACRSWAPSNYRPVHWPNWSPLQSSWSICRFAILS